MRTKKRNCTKRAKAAQPTCDTEFRVESSKFSDTSASSTTNRYDVVGMADIPREILYKILMETAIMSSMEDTVDRNYERVLLQLSLVCKHWQLIVTNDVFRESFLRQLLAKDLTFHYRSSAGPKADINADDGYQLTVLGDELFIWQFMSTKLDVFDIKMPQGPRLRSNRLQESFSLTRHINLSLPADKEVCDLQSCDGNRSLYISWRADAHEVSPSVYRISPDDGRTLCHWQIPIGSECSDSFDMSVNTITGNVLISDHKLCQVLEFDENGNKLHAFSVKQILYRTSIRTESEVSFCCIFDNLSGGDNSYIITRNERYYHRWMKTTRFRLKQDIVTGETQCQVVAGPVVRKRTKSRNSLRSIMTEKNAGFLATLEGLGSCRTGSFLSCNLYLYGPNINRPHRVRLQTPDSFDMDCNSNGMCFDRRRGRLYLSFDPISSDDYMCHAAVFELYSDSVLEMLKK